MATKQDYDGLAEQLAVIGRPIVVGFEATGNYHRTLAHRLLTAGSSCASSLPWRLPEPGRRFARGR
jgi:transposase